MAVTLLRVLVLGVIAAAADGLLFFVFRNVVQAVHVLGPGASRVYSAPRMRLACLRRPPGHRPNLACPHTL